MAPVPQVGDCSIHFCSTFFTQPFLFMWPAQYNKSYPMKQMSKSQPSFKEVAMQQAVVSSRVLQIRTDNSKQKRKCFPVQPETKHNVNVLPEPDSTSSKATLSFLSSLPGTSLHCKTTDRKLLHSTVCLFISQLMLVLTALTQKRMARLS